MSRECSRTVSPTVWAARSAVPSATSPSSVRRRPQGPRPGAPLALAFLASPFLALLACGGVSDRSEPSASLRAARAADAALLTAAPPLLTPSAPTPPGAAPPYTVADGLPRGAIRGVVWLPGGRPAVDVFVWLDGPRQGKAPPFDPPPTEIVFDEGKVRPRALVLPALGAPLAVANEDTSRHEPTLDHLGELRGDLGALGRLGGLGASSGDGPIQRLHRLPMPLEGQCFVVRIDRPGLVRLSDPLHSGEVAYVVNPPHPYFALTDDEGFFGWTEVPAGTYRLVAYRPGLDGGTTLGGEASARVAVGGSAQVEIVLHSITPTERQASSTADTSADAGP